MQVRGEVAERLKAAVCSSPVSLSAIFVFPNKSARLNYLLDQASWLQLALRAPFWELTGTISGTVPYAPTVAAVARVECPSPKIHLTPSDRILGTGRKNGCFKKIEEPRIVCALRVFPRSVMIPLPGARVEPRSSDPVTPPQGDQSTRRDAEHQIMRSLAEGSGETTQVLCRASV